MSKVCQKIKICQKKEQPRKNEITRLFCKTILNNINFYNMKINYFLTNFLNYKLIVI